MSKGKLGSVRNTKSNSIDCFVANVDNSIEEFEMTAFPNLNMNNGNLKVKPKIQEVPQTQAKIGIYHFDSMSNEETKKEYLIICKVFKHIVNYLMIKQINQELTNCEIDFTQKITEFKEKEKQQPQFMFKNPEMNLKKEEGEESSEPNEEEENNESAKDQSENDEHTKQNNLVVKNITETNLDQLPKKMICKTRRLGLFNKSNSVLRSIIVPRQKNGSDCGICVLENIEQILFKKDYLLDFKSELNQCKFFIFL
jgi:vacuolar-type H+-ATPase subunit I/STV1